MRVGNFMGSRYQSKGKAGIIRRQDSYGLYMCPGGSCGALRMIYLEGHDTVRSATSGAERMTLDSHLDARLSRPK